jgi:hypothetical protein
MSQELIPFNKRRANIKFATWVALAGGRVRGWNRQEEEERQRKREKREQAERMRLQAEQLSLEAPAASSASKPLLTGSPALSPAASPNDIFFSGASNNHASLDLLSAPVNYSGTLSGSGFGDSVRSGERTPTTAAVSLGIVPGGVDGDDRPAYGNGLEIWPLQLIEFDDKDQFEMLYQLLYKLPHISYYYLVNFIFPPVMRHQGLKLSASGQALGGDMLFNKRLGFSGTPSDLLPLELGKCQYEKGSDGKMMNYLSSPEIMSWELLDADWTPTTLLERIATASPPVHALIDTGALITGFSNEEVARFLLVSYALTVGVWIWHIH